MEKQHTKAILLDKAKINRTITRLAHEIIERNAQLDNIAIIGVRTRGDLIARRLCNKIFKITNHKVLSGTLDVTFYRDDFRTNLGSPKVGASDIMFDVNDKDVIVIDDVLYTGRTIRAGLDEIFMMGRPKSVQLSVLVDRGHRELPIKADYVGKNYPTSINEHIHVYLEEIDNEDSVLLVEYK